MTRPALDLTGLPREEAASLLRAALEPGNVYALTGPGIVLQCLDPDDDPEGVA
ncbi:hypothetical protein [Actinomyces provencensis]|uniref:hypothetical protein n=1 Tax=Actinomyces provencensis TaxID=1720198 RepID=UPI0012B64167|nr:hypothetical protein [Actinomyces provencensis]